MRWCEFDVRLTFRGSRGARWTGYSNHFIVNIIRRWSKIEFSLMYFWSIQTHAHRFVFTFRTKRNETKSSPTINFFTHTKLHSSPVSINRFSTDSIPSTWPRPHKNNFGFRCDSNNASRNLACVSISQNMMSGLVFFKIRAISSLVKSGRNGTFGQPKPIDAKNIGNKSSVFDAIMPKNWRRCSPRFCKFCAARVARNRTSSNVNCTPLSSFICADVITLRFLAKNR